MTAEERLVEAATRSFARRGVHASRLEDIRREAGASVGAVYHHFPGKEALHAEAWLRALADYQAGFVEALERSEDAEAGVTGGVRYHLRWVMRNRDAAALLQRGRPSGPRYEQRLARQNREFFAKVRRWWREHSGRGALREMDPELLHALWLGPADSYCRHWLAGHNRKPPTGAVRELADAAWANLRSAGSR